MAAALEDFPSWLSRTLLELNTDESVFGAYITGILDSDETAEEKCEALHGILSEIIENDKNIGQICDEIIEKWQFHKPKDSPLKLVNTAEVDEKLVKLLESQSLATTKQRQYTAEEKKIREAILSQYSQMTDDEEEVEGAKDTEQKDLGKNTNVQSVVNAEKVKREQAKLDSQKKKEKDKEDREKQKQLREEKKEKRKTQKGERRR